MAEQKPASEVPLSSEAQEAKELMQQQLLRKMANKMMAEAIEEERQRRIKQEEEANEDAVRRKAFDQLITVQEDLIHTLNLMKVKKEVELEQAQRVTTERKVAVHDELLRKAAVKQVDEDMEGERNRRIAESKDEHSADNVERRKTYDRLVVVQEDLLKTIQGMKADAEMKIEQQVRITEDKKKTVHEQLVHQVGKRSALQAMDSERKRRIDETEHLTEEELQRRVNISKRMVDVQKELLSTHKPTKASSTSHSQEVLEEAKAYMQEQLVRKAAQKDAIAAMEQEQKRRVEEAPTSPKGGVSDAQAEVMEQIVRKANIKQAKDMADATQQEYIVAEQKARAQEDTVRKIHQKEADRAMVEEQQHRVSEMEGKKPPAVSQDIKQGIKDHPLSPK